MTRLPTAWHAREQLSVWPTGAVHLCDREYVPETGNDSRGVPPAIAAYAIARYSQPSSVVLDPDCGAGVVVVEALRAGRHAIGMTRNPRWWRIARANTTAAKHRGAWHDGAILDTGSATQSVRFVESVDLVLTAIRLPAMVDSPSPDSDCLSGLREAACLLRPGGYAVVILRTHRTLDGALVDLASLVSCVGAANGLIPVDRCIALTGQLRDNCVVVRSSTVEREAADRARRAGIPIGLVAHRTVVILRRSTRQLQS